MTTARGPAVTRAGFGTAGLGNLRRVWTDAEARAVLQAAWDAGVRHFDTAPHYGLGLAEQRLGAFLADKPREQFVVSTKVGRLIRPTSDGRPTLDDEGFVVRTATHRVWDNSASGIRSSLVESLERLGLDRVDTLYLHDPERHGLEASMAEGLPALAALQRDGIVDRVGVGSMDSEALRLAADSEHVDQLMVAGRHTLASPDRDGVLEACHRNGVAVEVAAVFNGGLLADTPRRDAVYDYRAVSGGVLDRAEQITVVCARNGVAVRVAALQFPFLDPAVVRVVFGGDDPDQVRANVAALAEDVPEALWHDLARARLIP